MLYLPIITESEVDLRKAWRRYLRARRKVEKDPVARAGVNLTWQGWLGQYRYTHDPYPRSPVTQQMMDEIAAKVPSMPETMTFHPTDPPIWDNPKPGREHTCRICDGTFHYGAHKTSHQRPVSGANFADAEPDHITED